MKLSSSRSDET